MVGDITKDEISTLPAHTTASNFGRVSEEANKNDIALGIFNLVFQTIGVMAVFASRGENEKNIVAIGNLTRIPQCREVFDALEGLYPYNFIIPPHAEHGTCIGAALALLDGNNSGLVE